MLEEIRDKGVVREKKEANRRNSREEIVCGREADRGRWTDA